MPKFEEICFKVLSNQAMTLPQHLQVKEDGESSCVAQLEVVALPFPMLCVCFLSWQPPKVAVSEGAWTTRWVPCCSDLRCSTQVNMRELPQVQVGVERQLPFDSMYFFPPSLSIWMSMSALKQSFCQTEKKDEVVEMLQQRHGI